MSRWRVTTLELFLYTFFVAANAALWRYVSQLDRTRESRQTAVVIALAFFMSMTLIVAALGFVLGGRQLFRLAAAASLIVTLLFVVRILIG